MLASVVDDGPIHVPGWVIETALSEIPTTSQRGASKLPWRHPMFKPLALVIATAALIALLAIPLVGGAIGPGPTPTPSPTPSPTPTLGLERPYTTSLFTPGITFPLVQDGVTAFRVVETADMVTISPPTASTEQLLLMRLDGMRVIGDGEEGDAASLDTLVRLLDGRPGISARRERRPDVDQPLSFRVAGVDAYVIVVTIDPTIAVPGSPLLRTSAGTTVDVPARPWTMYILPAIGTSVGDLLLLYHGSTEDFWTYAGTLLALPADLRPAGA